MIQLVAYMIAVYGIARLLQTSKLSQGEGFPQIVGILGVVGLALLAALVTQQAESINNLGI